MSRKLVITFEVDDDTVDDEELYELAERMVATLDPDPPVLVYLGNEVRREAPEHS